MVLEILSGENRKRAYVIYAVISGVIGASLAGFAAIAVTAPVAFVFASAFFNFIGTAFGILAANHVSDDTSVSPPQG